MNNKSHKTTPNNNFNDDSLWANFFDMAESYEDVDDMQADMPEDMNVELFANMETDTFTNTTSTDTGVFRESFSVPKVTYHTPEEVLKVFFGYDLFRTGQKDVIDSILSGGDTFAVMPTGAGKSVCYQVPAMLLPGITLVISPLISLMQDQVKALNEAGIAAAFINSSLSESEIYETLRRIRQGAYKIIYVAPERLITDSFLDLAMNIDISMITVDEAHCISQWGQDFRPSYMKIVEFVRRLPKRPIIGAFTATATENVREDILCTLGLINPFCLVTGFNRENLFFDVEKPKSKDKYILDYISNHADESGIIYCATRKNVDNLYMLLKSKGVSVTKYHAGMGVADRKKMQDDFIFDYVNIIVATNAFGMGIDKSNVRFVIHYNMPQSMENYYQEAGRAGRDGIASKCILLFAAQDIVINRFLLEHKEISDIESEDMQTVKERNIKRLQTMEQYCYTTECLRNYILKYFGENPEKPCDDCGNCIREFETLDMTNEAKQIINCIYEAKGRYGKNIIIDTLLGARTARLEEVGTTSYKTYGVLAKTNKNLLRRLLEELVVSNYLVVGDYHVIKLGDITPLKDADNKVMVKITDDDKILGKTDNLAVSKNSTKTSNKNSKGMESLTSAGFKLFDSLRELRLNIAREESVPPYIIFSDKTLIDMSLKVPTSRLEMLNVSGVGEVKYDKYGDRFVALIEKCIESSPELLQNKKKLEKAEKSAVETDTAKTDIRKIKKKLVKSEFFITEKESENFKYAEYYIANEIRDELNRICDTDGVKKLTASKIMEFLTFYGLIIEKKVNGLFLKLQTEEGINMGIKTVEKVSEKGTHYTILAYPPVVQALIVKHYIRFEMS